MRGSDTEAAQRWLRSIHKCGSISQEGNLCTQSENHTDRNHKAQIMGGAEDGKTLREWPW